MKFDLTKIDYTKEVTEQLKQQYHDLINQLIKTGTTDNEEEKEIVLFHGTSLSYLNLILIDGLSPNEETNISNFENELKANSQLVYLTNKWHYWYAHQSSINVLHTDDLYLPCYIECKVPASQLVIDEDFFHSAYIKNRIKTALKKHNPILELSYEECLNQYATVAHLGKITKEQIVAFTVLTNLEVFNERFIKEDSLYQKDLRKWGVGKGKGSLKLMDLFKLEDDPGNLTFYMKDIPPNSVVTEVIPREGKTSFALKFGEFKRES